MCIENFCIENMCIEIFSHLWALILQGIRYNGAVVKDEIYLTAFFIVK